jgi:hypothetical protein
MHGTGSLGMRRVFLSISAGSSHIAIALPQLLFIFAPSRDAWSQRHDDPC